MKRKSNRKATPQKTQAESLNEIVEQQHKLAQESLKKSEENRKKVLEQTKIFQDYRRLVLIKQLQRLTTEPNIDYNEIERVTIELQKLYGIEATPRVNHCKTCLFQKLCDKFTSDGINGLSCSQPAFNKRYLELWKEAKKENSSGIIYTKNLQVWHDTQEQLDARFGLN